MIMTLAFGDRVAFFCEKQTKPYTKYGAGSIAGEKVAISQKAFQRVQLCWTAGKAGETS